MWTADKEMNMEGISALMNTIWAVAKKFFRPYFNYHLSSVHDCEDRFPIQIMPSLTVEVV